LSSQHILPLRLLEGCRDCKLTNGGAMTLGKITHSTTTFSITIKMQNSA
jgi:hypothetical protein